MTKTNCLFDGQSDVSVFDSKFNNRSKFENRIIYTVISVMIRPRQPAIIDAGGYPGILLFQWKIN